MQQDTGNLKELDIKNEADLEAMKKNEDLVFHVGERVAVKGGEFRIKSMGKKFMMLEGLPGTRIQK